MASQQFLQLFQPQAAHRSASRIHQRTLLLLEIGQLLGDGSWVPENHGTSRGEAMGKQLNSNWFLFNILFRKERVIMFGTPSWEEKTGRCLNRNGGGLSWVWCFSKCLGKSIRRLCSVEHQELWPVVTWTCSISSEKPLALNIACLSPGNCAAQNRVCMGMFVPWTWGVLQLKRGWWRHTIYMSHESWIYSASIWHIWLKSWTVTVVVPSIFLKSGDFPPKSPLSSPWFSLASLQRWALPRCATRCRRHSEHGAELRAQSQAKQARGGRHRDCSWRRSRWWCLFALFFWGWNMVNYGETNWYSMINILK